MSEMRSRAMRPSEAASEPSHKLEPILAGRAQRPIEAEAWESARGHARSERGEKNGRKNRAERLLPFHGVQSPGESD
jgi:hypothetical protein